MFAASFGDRPGQMLLDTGAGRTVLSTELAGALGLESGLQLMGGGIGGLQSLGTLQVPEMQAGACTFRQFSAVSMDLSFLEFDGTHIDGIFGSDLLQQCRLEVDFEAHTLRFLDPDVSDAPEGYELHPLDWFLGLPVISLEIAGLPARALLDTGNVAMTTLHAPFFRAHFLEGSGPRSQVRGVGGDFPVTLGRLSRVRMAGLELADVPAVAPAPDAEGGLLNAASLDVNAGIALLRNFRLLFDYPDNQIGFAARRKPVPPAPAGQLGIAVRAEDGAFVVRDVYAGSDAAAAGVAEGDTLVAAGGRPVAGLSTGELLELLRGAPSTRVRLTLSRDGEERTLELERRDYAPLFVLRP